MRLSSWETSNLATSSTLRDAVVFRWRIWWLIGRLLVDNRERKKRKKRLCICDVILDRTWIVTLLLHSKVIRLFKSFNEAVRRIRISTGCWQQHLMITSHFIFDLLNLSVVFAFTSITKLNLKFSWVFTKLNLFYLTFSYYDDRRTLCAHPFGRTHSSQAKSFCEWTVPTVPGTQMHSRSGDSTSLFRQSQPPTWYCQQRRG